MVYMELEENKTISRGRPSTNQQTLKTKHDLLPIRLWRSRGVTLRCRTTRHPGCRVLYQWSQTEVRSLPRCGEDIHPQHHSYRRHTYSTDFLHTSRGQDNGTYSVVCLWLRSPTPPKLTDENNLVVVRDHPVAQRDRQTAQIYRFRITQAQKRENNIGCAPLK